MKYFSIPKTFFLFLALILAACSTIPATTLPPSPSLTPPVSTTPVPPIQTAPPEPSPTIGTGGIEPAYLSPTPEVASPIPSPFLDLQVISLENVAQLNLLASIPTLQDAHIAWSEDATMFAAFNAFNSTQIQIYSLLSELAPLVLEHSQPVMSAVFSLDGTMLVSTSQDGMLHVWDSATGTEIANLNLTSFFQSSMWADSLEFSPDGTQLAVFGGQDSTLLLFNFPFDHTPPTRIAWTEHASPVVSVYPSPDWQTFAWVGRGTLVLMNADGTVRGEQINQEDFITGIFFSPDSQRLFVQTAKTINEVFAGVVIVYDVQSGQALQILAHPEFVHSSTLSPDSATLAASSATQVTLWDWATGTELLTIPNLPDVAFNLTFSPDGTLLASNFNLGVIQVWDVTTGQTLTSFQSAGEVSSLRFLLGGTVLAATQYDGTVQLLGVAP